MPDNKPNIICKLCYDNDDHFSVPRTKLGEALIEAHFMEEHPEEYKKYLEFKKGKE